MNSYSYDEIEVGQSISFEKEITKSDMEKFLEISGDTSPIHLDENYAKNRGYSGRVVYGLLTSALYSTVAGVYLPGEHCLLHSVDIKYKNPVYIGDKLLVEGKVHEKNDLFKVLTIKASIKNSEGKKVSTAVIKAGVAR